MVLILLISCIQGSVVCLCLVVCMCVFYSVRVSCSVCLCRVVWMCDSASLSVCRLPASLTHIHTDARAHTHTLALSPSLPPSLPLPLSVTCLIHVQPCSHLSLSLPSSLPLSRARSLCLLGVSARHASRRYRSGWGPQGTHSQKYFLQRLYVAKKLGH